MPEGEMRNWTGGGFHLFNDLRHWKVRYAAEQYIFIAFLAKNQIDASLQYCCGNPPDKPKSREVEFSEKEVLHEEIQIQ
jgi:hypothetical protein